MPGQRDRTSAAVAGDQRRGEAGALHPPVAARPGADAAVAAGAVSTSRAGDRPGQQPRRGRPGRRPATATTPGSRAGYQTSVGRGRRDVAGAGDDDDVLGERVVQRGGERGLLAGPAERQVDHLAPWSTAHRTPSRDDRRVVVAVVLVEHPYRQDLGAAGRARRRRCRRRCGPAIRPATVVPWPTGSSAAVAAGPSTKSMPGQHLAGRSGWLASTPESMTATVTPRRWRGARRVGAPQRGRAATGRRGPCPVAAPTAAADAAAAAPPATAGGQGQQRCRRPARDSAAPRTRGDGAPAGRVNLVGTTSFTPGDRRWSEVTVSSLRGTHDRATFPTHHVGGRWASCTRRTPSLRVTSRPGPAASGRAGRCRAARPRPGRRTSAGRATPARAAAGCTGSYSARPAPPPGG